MAPHPRLRRGLSLTAKIFGFFLVGLLGLVALVLLGINLPPVSSWVAGRVNAALEPMFQGRLVLHRLGHLDFGGLSDAELEVFDPAGNSVLKARDIDVRLFWPGVAWQAAVQRPELLRVPIDRVSLADVELTLLDDGEGSPTLAQAFSPKQPPKDEPESAGGTAIELRALEIGNTRVRGALAGVDPIDTDLNQLEAQLENDPRGTHVLLQHLEIRARQLPQVGTLSGVLTADVTLPAEPEPGAPAGDPNTAIYALSPAPVRRILAGFQGNIADSEAKADVRLNGEQLEASFGMPAIAPATVTRVSPALAPRAPLALSAKASGALTDLAFETRITQPGASGGDPAEIAASGKLERQGEDSKLNAKLSTSRVDLSRLLADGAQTALDVVADAQLAFGARGGEGSYRVVAANSKYAGQALPRTSVEGKLNMPSEAPLTTRGQVEIAENGAPTQIDFDVKSGERGAVADISSLTRLMRPPRVRALSGGLQLTGEIASKAHYDQAADQVDAELRVNVQDIRHPELRANRLDVAAMARGKASEPNLELLVNLTGVSAGERKFSRVRVHALGNSDELNVGAQLYGDKPDRIDLKTIVRPSSEQLLSGAVLRIADEAGRVTIRAASVTRTPARLRVDQLSIEGPGRATASLSYGSELERLELDARQLDAAQLLRIVGVQSPLRSAKLDVSADYRRNAPSKLSASVSDIGLGKLRGGTAKADFELRGGKLSGQADLELARGAKTVIALDGVRSPLGGGPAPSLENLGGDVTLQGDVDLARLQPFLPFAGIERATGQIQFDVSIQRNAGRPALHAKLATRKLVLVSERPDAEQMPSSEQAKLATPWTLRGVDVELDGKLENQVANLKARLFDRRGDVFLVNADMRDIGDLARGGQAFQHAPFNARLEVPRREFERWPAPLRPAQIQGALTLQVDAQGTLADPHVQARGRIDDFRAASDDTSQRHVDIELGAQYQLAGGNLLLTAHDGGKAVLGLDTRWNGDAARAAEALEAPDGKSPLSGDVTLTLDDFPVEVVPDLQNAHVAGNLSGKAVLQGLGKDAHFTLDLNTQRLLVDRLELNQLSAKVDTRNGRLVVETRLAGEGGSAEVKATTGLTWGARLVPVPDQQLEGAFVAKSFPLATLQPLVEGSLSELQGKLDADIRAELDGGQPRLHGQAALSEGVIHLPSVGQRFSDIGAKLAITPDSLRVTDVSARGLSGGFKAEAEAKLQGLAPVSAKATLSIDEDDKLPITVEGEAIGDAWGKVETLYRADAAAKTNYVDVDLKKFHVELPAAPPQGIQDLQQAEHVRVGYFRQDKEFVSIPLQPLEKPEPPSDTPPTQTVVNVDLGELWVEKGEQVEVGVGGKIQAKLGSELDVTGKIETKRGTLDISGKKFEIERGSVSFTGGPPDNPIISAVARYDAPVGYTVYAEYTGTATQGKLGLRSEPPLSQDEILTLLMFGTPDGSFGAGSGSNDSLSTAVSVAGGTAAQGLNRALSKVTDLDVSARVDTSTGAPRPELVLQLTPRVAARVTQALGEPSPGQSPDRTFVTLELRIASAWALSTMVGDRGASAFDLIWRRRY